MVRKYTTDETATDVIKLMNVNIPNMEQAALNLKRKYEEDDRYSDAGNMLVVYEHLRQAKEIMELYEEY